MFSLAWTLCKARRLKSIILGLWHGAQSKAELAAEVLIVGGHCQGQPHVLLKELLCGHLAAVQADGGAAGLLQVATPVITDTFNAVSLPQALPTAAVKQAEMPQQHVGLCKAS